MGKFTKEQIDRHIKTHSKTAVNDQDAVSKLCTFLISDGKIKTDFADNDKWPNVDGGFDLVSDPTISRRPNQRFTVQIKSTSSDDKFDDNGNFVYRLQNLAFPAYVLSEVTRDPCILFIVINPGKRGQTRIFWKYMSYQLLSSIDFDNESTTIKFTKEEELFDTDKSVNEFVDKLIKISDNHSFVKLLSLTEFSYEDVKKMVVEYNRLICEEIALFKKTDMSRDSISKRMLNNLQDLCESTLLYNAFRLGYEPSTLRLAVELASDDIRTKFLRDFLQSLHYIARRIPDEGQSERLMLNYYSFLWQIREYFKNFHEIDVLENLELFPLNLDDEDKDYQELVAASIEKVAQEQNGYKNTRYYVHKITPFFVGKSRYFEVTLQLAGVYATKFNRLTVYTKKYISTNYPIQVGYSESDITIWENVSKIKVLTDWRVAIDTSTLNTLLSILNKEPVLQPGHGERGRLMEFLTESGINLLDLIDLNQDQFQKALNRIYGESNSKRETNTKHFKIALEFLRQKFSGQAQIIAGRNVIRYILIRLREEILEDIKLGSFEPRAFPSKDISIKMGCYAFDKNPLLYNLLGSKSSRRNLPRDAVRAVGLDSIQDKLPYLIVRNKIEETGEIYIPKEEFGENFDIDGFNSKLVKFDRDQGNLLGEEDEKVYIQSYERDTLDIIRRLQEFEQSGNDGQQQLNNKFIKDNDDGKTFEDRLKMLAITKVFVQSKILMIYGAAGTGKTTLMNYISDLMTGRSKLFLAKTHTAVENLKFRIKNPGSISGVSTNFLGVDKFCRNPVASDIVFIDECSTIDNRKMREVLSKINPDALIILAGDNHQIESIDFGNWFLYAKEILKEKSIVELDSTWRTKDNNLLGLWREVRKKGNLIATKLVIDGPFSKEITKELFQVNKEEREIVLCLNYDGRFGLNNINNYFQDANTKEAFVWQEWKYKVDDPILFNNSKRFPILHNNLKGTIFDIAMGEGSITFTIDVEKNITATDIKHLDLEIVEWLDVYTRIRFTVYERHGGAMNEEERDKARRESVVPFQVAYAVSIHKSQGLEFDSVKIVIPRSNEENISHGVFYTAITRAKKKLTIFWSAEVMQSVVSGFTEFDQNFKSLDIIKRKLMGNKNEE